MLCAVIAKKNFDENLNLAEKIKNFDIDAIEFRFDYLKEQLREDQLLQLSEIFKEKIKIATLMPEWEGGNFKGSENDRLRLLYYYSNFCDFATIEIKAIKENFDLCEKILNSRNLIIAAHNFERCYKEDEIEKIIDEIEKIKEKYKNGIKNRIIITKIACKVESFYDSLKILRFFNKENYGKCILLGMGKEGIITRIVNYYAGFLTYVSVEEKTAEGQLSFEEFREILKILGWKK